MIRLKHKKTAAHQAKVRNKSRGCTLLTAATCCLNHEKINGYQPQLAVNQDRQSLRRTDTESKVITTKITEPTSDVACQKMER